MRSKKRISARMEFCKRLYTLGLFVAKTFSLTMQCTDCANVLNFPIKQSLKSPWLYRCPHCNKQFGISEELARQIKLFMDLCTQLKASEEILSSASVGVTVGSTQVKIPFKLLLTRLRSHFDLEINGSKVTVSTRTEPTKIVTLSEQL
jgi:hypothetical protein